jgi:hypothetical protein
MFQVNFVCNADDADPTECSAQGVRAQRPIVGNRHDPGTSLGVNAPGLV